MNKLVVAVIIGMLLLTACDEGTNNDGNKTALITPAKAQDNIINLSNMNISSIRIKELNTEQDSILIKDGIIREFRDFLSSMKFTKIDESFIPEYEAEILDGGELVLKISFSGGVVSFSEKVMIGDKVLERGDYELENWISDNIKHFYEGKVLDPQNNEISANITTPDEISLIEMIDRGSTKINRYEVYSKLYDFAKENFCSRKFEVLESKKIDDYESMSEQKDSAIKKCRALVIGNPFINIKIESDNEYDELISAPSMLLVEHAEKPETYQIYTEKMIIDIKVDNNFVKGFEEVFDTNTEVSKVLTPDEIEELFNEKKPYYWDYIWKNLDIEGWYADENVRLERQYMNLSNQGESYKVLMFYYYDIGLRLLFFKEDKYIDYIDFGGRMAGTEYRMEKAGDKVFIVGKSCRGYGTGMSRYFEDWYTLTDNGKKLVVSLPYDDYNVGPIGGYYLVAKSIKLNNKGEISLTADYSLGKIYMRIDICDDTYGVNVEVPKKVIFKWDNEKDVFVSEFAPDDMGVTEIPPESDDIVGKCTELLKSKYKELTEAMLLLDEETYEYNKENRKKSWELFLNDCEDCDEKSALLEMLKKK